jgi:hypothetical protein
MALNRIIADVTYQTLKGPGVTPISGGVLAVEKIVGQVIGIMTIVAVIYFTFQVIIAGYAYIAASGDEKAIENARKALTNSVLGLTIVIIAVGLGALIATLIGIPNVLDLENMFTLMGL